MAALDRFHCTSEDWRRGHLPRYHSSHYSSFLRKNEQESIQMSGYYGDYVVTHQVSGYVELSHRWTGVSWKC